MSDPFDNIDNEIYLDRFKSYFYKFKKLIIISVASIIVVSFSLSLYINHKKKETIKISDYYIKILSIIDNEPDRAKEELQKLVKLNNPDYKNLSNLLVFKLNFQNKKFQEAIDSLDKIEDNLKSNSYLHKILNYYYAQVFLELDEIDKFENNIGELLSYGGMWAMLAHELRGHLFFSKKEYSSALKNFNKIINNQQATVSIKNRALEMVNNINLYYVKAN